MGFENRWIHCSTVPDQTKKKKRELQTQIQIITKTDSNKKI